MALQIEDLVASIRKDGVDAAQADAAKIIEDARKQAADIVAQAKKDAEKAKADAERDIQVRDASAKATLVQASRDVQLSLKKALGKELDAILEAKVAGVLSGKDLATLIAEVVKSGAVDTGKQEVQVSEKTWKALADTLKSALADELKKGLVVRPVAGVDAGFRIADKDGSGFYDFSAEEISAMMKPFLGEELAAIVAD